MSTSFWSIAAAIALCVGCVSDKGRPQQTHWGGENPDLSKVSQGDPALMSDLEQVNIRTKRDESGRLRVQLELHNKRASNLNIEYAVEWFDASGFLIDSATHWTTLAVGGKDFQTISFLAPTPAASVYKLKVQRSDAIR